MLIETVPGFALRKARLERGWTLEQAANALCATVNELSLVEDENYRAFANLTDARVHIRCYAELLGLDPDPLLQSLTAAPPPIGAGHDRTLSGTGSQPNAGPPPVASSASGSGPRSRRHRRRRFGPARPGVLLAALAAVALSLLLVPAGSDLVLDLASRVTGRDFSVRDVGSPRPEPLPDPASVGLGRQRPMPTPWERW